MPVSQILAWREPLSAVMVSSARSLFSILFDIDEEAEMVMAWQMSCSYLRSWELVGAV